MTDIERDNYVHPGQRIAQNGTVLGVGQGMSLRDYFAGQAINAAFNRVIALVERGEIDPNEVSAAEVSAVVSYQIADAMLKARNA